MSVLFLLNMSNGIDQQCTGIIFADTNRMEPAQQAEGSIKNPLAFFTFSFVTYAFLFGVNYAAAEDVLASTNMQTSIVYLCDFGPYFVGAVFLPVFMDKLRPLSRVLATVSLEIVGIILVAVPGTLAVKLTGTCLLSFANAVSDVALLSMTSFYEEITSRAYTAGAGLGAGFGVIYYTGKIMLLVSVENGNTPQWMHFTEHQTQWKSRDMKARAIT